MRVPETPADQSVFIEKGLRRVLAPNPSAMTHKGTNSYIVGKGEVAVIDPGPDDDGHLAALLAALGPGERVSHIFVTHAHLDHSALAPRLARATGAPVLALGAADAARSPLMTDLAARGRYTGTEGTDLTFQPDIHLADGAQIEGDGWRITALHTPGHLSNHLCLMWNGGAFSGDHVMGWSTSIVAPPDGDMGAYMRALDRLAGSGPSRLWPGHGAPIADPGGRIADLVAHRHARAAAIRAALRDGPMDASSLAARIYSDIPARLLPAAALNVFAHLIEMLEKNEAAPLSELAFASPFALSDRTEDFR